MNIAAKIDHDRLPVAPRTDEYAQWLRGQGLTASTTRQRIDLAARFWREHGHSFDVPGHVVAAWLDSYTGWTRRTYQAGLSNLYRWLTQTGQVQHNPLEAMKAAPAPRPEPRPLSDAELGSALSLASPRLRAWLLLGAYAGLRAHEIAKFHGHDIHLDWLTVTGKGGKKARVPTHPILWALAQHYPRDGFWFPSRNRRREHVSASRVTIGIRDHFRAIGIEYGAAHRLRATYGTSLLRAGVNVRVVQELMRHNSLASTEHYLAVANAEQAAAVRLLSVPPITSASGSPRPCISCGTGSPRSATAAPGTCGPFSS